jgi:hypothetical protein
LTNNSILRVSVLSTPFPKWKVAPFFTIGGGVLKSEPTKSYIFSEGRRDNFANVGLGLRYYISRRFFFRADVKENIVFIDEERNGEFLEWKLGFAFFY